MREFTTDLTSLPCGQQVSTFVGCDSNFMVGRPVLDWRWLLDRYEARPRRSISFGPVRTWVPMRSPQSSDINGAYALY